ncbi:MAG: peptidylprolyl isomerase, FKBP-type [Gammaproteobacteria bacterium]|nr:peptidylprolyl isomerase, FKBP-type [Gammaproteobacteria bacterium]
MQRRCRKFLAVNSVAVAVLLTGATLAQAQNTPPPAAPAPSTPAPAAGKKPAAKTPAKEGAAAAKTPANPKIQGSYALGVSMGEQLHRAGLTNDSVAVERIAQGLRDALSGKAKMSEADQESIASLVRGARAGAGEANHAAAAAFLAENGKKKDIVTTASGLQYRVISPGSGEAPKPTDQVSVNYRGTLLDGTEFDSSYKRGQPATFPVNGVIPGWQEALVLMKPGAKYELFIPPKLAYDIESPPSIPPGSMLKFDVELLSVKPPQAQTAPHPDVHPQPPPPPPPPK